MSEMGIRYNRNDVIYYDVDREIPQFCCIVHILVKHDIVEECYLFCLDIVEKNSHYRAYIVKTTKKCIHFRLKDVKYIFPTIIHRTGNVSLVSFHSSINI